MKPALFLVALALLLLSCAAPKLEDDNTKLVNDYSDNPISIGGHSGTISENGSYASFGVHLNLQPTQNVTLDISSSNQSEVTVEPSQLVFTPNNWDSEQIVHLQGQEDYIWDRNQKATISFQVSAEDAIFQDLELENKEVSNLDNDNILTGMATTQFGFLRSGGSCPDGYVEGSFTLDTEDEGNIDSLIGDTGDAVLTYPGIILYLCFTNGVGQYNITNIESSTLAILANGTCPDDYTEGKIAIHTEENHNSNASSGDFGTSNFYTSSTGKGYFLMRLYHKPSTAGTLILKSSNFTLFAKGDCPPGAVAGSVTLDTEDNKNRDDSSGTTGDSGFTTSSNGQLNLKLCTYSP